MSTCFISISISISINCASTRRCVRGGMAQPGHCPVEIPAFGVVDYFFLARRKERGKQVSR